MELELYNSMICRLCAVENSSATLLFSPDETGESVSSIVNSYLPIKISDDGKLPRTICPPCNLQLHSTKAFLDHVVAGQQKLRELWKEQTELQKRLVKERMRLAQGHDIIIPETITTDDGNEAQILIHLPDGTLFTAEHSLTLRMEGLERPKRKRGRPPKPRPDPEQMAAAEAAGREMEELKTEAIEQEDCEEEVEEEGDGRRRRRKKIPRRFMEAVQGKELERIFREEGVIDEDDDDGVKAADISVLGGPPQSSKDEVIGHMETPDGESGELIIVNRGRGRGRPRNPKKRKINYECEICGRGFQHRSRYLFHKTYHKGVKYECGTCQKQFNSKEHLDLHHKTLQHSGEVVVELPSESKKEDDLEKENNLRCEKCDEEFDSKENYEVHLQTVHEGEKPFKCQLCPMTFPYQSSLRYHITSQHDAGNSENASSSNAAGDTKSDGKGGYECDICGKVLNHPSSVLYHKEAEHNDGRRFVCSKCGKGFKHRQLLQRHQLVHSEDRPYVCNDCGSSFKTKANWINHQATHTGEKKFFCDLCGHQFAHKTSLTLHHRWHAGDKPFECNVCHKKFSQNGNLQEHLRIHSGEKPFCCDYCGRKFTTSSQFKLHVKRHTGERPWKCEFCGKSFLHKDTWKCHTRRHKGEKPFRCNFCGRGFTEQWALKKHMRLHTGEKPYSCNVCGKLFADCSNLTKHKKVHRENKPSLGTAVPDRTVWNIIRTQMSDDLGAAAGEDGMVNVGIVPDTSGAVTNINEDGEAVQQIIYVSYQDPDDPTENHTLHIVDDVAASASNELKLLSTPGDISSNFGDPDGTDATLDLGQLIAPRGLPVTDEEGNPIHFTMQDGSQLQITTPDGQSLMVTTEDGRAIPVQLTTTEGHPITGFSTANVSVPTDSLQIAAGLGGKDLSCVGDRLIVDSAVNSVDPESYCEQHIEFTTQDGQKLRLVTASDVNQLQLVADLMSAHMPQVQ